MHFGIWFDQWYDTWFFDTAATGPQAGLTGSSSLSGSLTSVGAMNASLDATSSVGAELSIPALSDGMMQASLSGSGEIGGTIDKTTKLVMYGGGSRYPKSDYFVPEIVLEPKKKKRSRKKRDEELVAITSF